MRHNESVLRVEAETKKGCRDWLGGHRGSLWQPGYPRGHSKQGAQHSLSAESRRHKRTTELLAENLLQRGCNNLMREPPVEVTDAVTAEMRSKHPTARVGEQELLRSLRTVAAAAAVQVGTDSVAKGLADSSRGSSSGPSGLRPQHDKEALVPGLRDEILRQVTAVVNLLARGHAPDVVQEWLRGAVLAAIPKPDGTLRPVAVGETWRRLTAKVLASEASESFRAF